MSIAKKVVDLFPSSKHDAVESTEDVEDQGGPTELFECEPCGTTYISGSMDVCPNCERPVESVRSEKDLGML